jgi:hypothetical protein
MNKRLLSTLVMVCIAMALSGCSSPAEGTSFQPPAGWKSTPGMFGRMQLWMNGTNSNDRQILMVIRGDKSMATSDISRGASPMGGTQNIHDIKQKTVKLCGGSQSAQYFTGQGEGGNGSNRVMQQVEGMTTTIGDSKYFAIYIRPAALKADMQAENALYSLCPKAT